MPDWWEGNPREQYWCEISGRTDPGADLKCPKTQEDGGPDWSYDLILQVQPGDIVFHYSTRRKAYIAASVAGGPVDARDIIWAPHGTSGRSKKEVRTLRPGWWRPLYGFTVAQAPLTLAELHNPIDDAWIRGWIDRKEQHGRVASPFQRYPRELRGAQGYLTKMPADFVERWGQLSQLANSIQVVQDVVATASPTTTAQIDQSAAPQLTPRLKNDSDYQAVITAGVQQRTRSHERLVRNAVEWLQGQGATVSTPHPIDMVLEGSPLLIVEVKIVGQRSALFAVREAIGQLLEYRHFRHSPDSELCILLDQPPDTAVVPYVEHVLKAFIIWWDGARLIGGPATSRRFTFLGAPRS